MYNYLLNRNLNVYGGREYQSFPIQHQFEFQIEEYLEGTFSTLLNALIEHPKTSVFRFELKIPKHYHSNSDRLIHRFFEFLQVQIDTDLQKRNNIQKTAVTSNLRYVVARGFNQFRTEQYHVLLMLNVDAYNGLTNVLDNVGGNVFNKIGLAWAEALENDFELIVKYRLVHIPKSPVSHINSIKGKPFNDWSSAKDIFLRFSHFTTADGKSFDQGYSPFLFSAN